MESASSANVTSLEEDLTEALIYVLGKDPVRHRGHLEPPECVQQTLLVGFVTFVLHPELQQVGHLALDTSLLIRFVFLDEFDL